MTTAKEMKMVTDAAKASGTADAQKYINACHDAALCGLYEVEFDGHLAPLTEHILTEWGYFISRKPTNTNLITGTTANTLVNEFDTYPNSSFVISWK